MLINQNSTLVVSVKGEKFEFGEQIVWLSRDHLAGRSTCVQLAQRIGQKFMKSLFKSSWPHKARQHEGNVLEKLKGISGILDVLAWDVPRNRSAKITNYTPSSFAHNFFFKTLDNVQ